MELYDLPDDVPFADPDYANYDTNVELAREEAHKAALTDWLKANGWTGPNTGREFSTPMADGYARYLFADGAGEKDSILVHLPYGDRWHSQDVQYIPEAEIVKRMDAKANLASLFSARSA